MKILKNVAIITLILVGILCINVKSFAKTVIVTTDGLNLRREASTDSEVMDIIEINKEVEYVEEQGNWYKVKYNGMTGYISKDYAKIKDESTSSSGATPNNGDTSSSGNTSSNEGASNNQNTNNAENTNTQQGGTTNAGTANAETNNIETTNTETANTETNNTQVNNPVTSNPETNAVQSSKYMKFTENTAGCILPLINSNIIYNFQKDDIVKAISFVNGWIYVESETRNAWVRADKLTDTGETQTNTNPQQPETPEEPQDTITEDPDLTGQIEVTPMDPKTMYVQEASIYVRSGPGTTYDVVDTLIANNSVTVTGKVNDWYQVKIGDTIGYIAGWLLGNSTKETTSRSDAERTISTSANANIENTSNETQPNTTNEVTPSKGEQIVNYAKQYLGCKYVYGGSGPSVFDCSGFTMYVYKNFGISLSHSATAQSKKGTYVAKEDLQPGDLVFFKDFETMNGIGHCGIYIGGGEFIHASSGTGYCVKISTLSSGSYSTRYETARRVI